jgi:hypothetical protein
VHVRVGHDRAREVRVGEEVLAAPLGRSDPVPGGELFQRRAAEAAHGLTS